MKFFKNKLTVTIIVLSVTFLVLITQSAERSKISFVESGIGTVVNPVQGVFYKVNKKIRNSIGFVLNIPDVKKENVELKSKNSKLESQLVEYKSLKDENERLRKMLNFKNQHSEFNYVGADIIGKSGGNYLDEFTINKGSNDGVFKGMIAITNEGLVGQVIATGGSWAKVQSLSNENLAVSAMVDSTKENSGVVKGFKDSQNNILAKLYFLPIDSKIKEKDIILTSGLGAMYPKGIRIGEVKSIEVDKGKVMKNAIIKPYVDLRKIEEVFIVIPKVMPNNKEEVKY
ncbi:TPA: rod shape-determining protein MreC [Clostridium botulinum]|uniref:rod shape-determining protein MreC n=1 Tax=Clostridium botulinum TaxID=1491 RepID=UPI0029BB9CCB|nr:rod shape-determining protein MreC [Clostridium botulinum]HDK7179808.1 rod shape-determining protein MreC [Clostridium botulinum]HDK7189339.1 rod shape-determining protein MreC [Clostridium botulinum]HDK7216560.1 rod shape-determining protein MreC [Clostridium botulinum]HDK7223259.1 rod shape-determining protein MreC [Clostridium botulinum]